MSAPTFRIRVLDRVRRDAPPGVGIELEPPRDLPILDLLDLRDDVAAMNATRGWERYVLQDMDALDPDADPDNLTPRAD